MARCTLNNMIMRNVRKTHAYQTMLVDLVLLGVVEKRTAEELLGYEMPSYIAFPAGVADTALPADVADDELPAGVADTELPADVTDTDYDGEE